MAVLTIRWGHQAQQICFDAPQNLSLLLAQVDSSLAQPCGGRGKCGKCAVLLSGSVSDPNEAEARLNVHLACQAIITGDAEVILPTIQPLMVIAGGKSADLDASSPMLGRYGAAVDLGTTTIVLQLYDLSNGRCIGAASMANPQAVIAADVIGRMEAAMNGQAMLLQQRGETAIATLLASACAQADIVSDWVASLVVTGNTTMLYLLNGYDPVSLSRAPFLADRLFGTEEMLHGRKIYFPGCLHAFVGADTSCALLASGIMDREETALLCDVGTNGEMALWHEGKLYITSTAAGPAFEGAGIQCGCASIPGAISRAERKTDGIAYQTIADQKAVGICGSGLIDIVACLLDAGILDESGLLEEGEWPLRDGIFLTQSDIRAVQLAKAAIFAGIHGLMHAAGCGIDEVKRMYIAGGFGSHLNLKNAGRIGLFPKELMDCACVIGNAALDGAALLLTNVQLREKIQCMQHVARHVRLDGNPVFTDHYIEAMLFEENL